MSTYSILAFCSWCSCSCLPYTEWTMPWMQWHSVRSICRYLRQLLPAVDETPHPWKPRHGQILENGSVVLYCARNFGKSFTWLTGRNGHVVDKEVCHTLVGNQSLMTFREKIGRAPDNMWQEMLVLGLRSSWSTLTLLRLQQQSQQRTLTILLYYIYIIIIQRILKGIERSRYGALLQQSCCTTRGCSLESLLGCRM